MKKRIILMITAVLLLIAQIPVSAQPVVKEVAKPEPERITLPNAVGEEIEEPSLEREEEENEKGDEIVFHTGSVTLHDAALGRSFSENMSAARQTILSGILAHSNSLSLYEYKITASELAVILQDMIDSEAYMFLVEYEYHYSSFGGYVYTYYPEYKMSEAESVGACELVEAELAAILENSGALQAEDAYQIALLLNDYIVSHFAYDTDYKNYDVYSMLVEKVGVCQAYMLLYDELLTRCGVEVTYSQSHAMNHIWNLVKIGDHYYHVDVTWNDSLPDQYGRVRHSYFMLSDAAFLNNPNGKSHYGWISDGDIQCLDTTYDDTYVSKVRSPFVTDGKDLYYINDSTAMLCRYEDAFTEGEALYKIEGVWRAADGKGYYVGVFSGLVCFEGKLYFNTPKSIGVYDTASGEVSFAVTVDGDDDITSLRYEGDRTVSYAIAPDPASEILRIETYRIPDATVYHACDVNCDGILNVEDINCMLIYLSGMNENPDWKVDVNKDGYINVEDLNLVLIELSTMD